MKRIQFPLFVLSCTLLMSACGEAQVPQSPPGFSCPAAAVNGSTYTPLNLSTPVNVVTYTDTPPTGEWCYVVQAYDGAYYSDPSAPSNPAASGPLGEIVVSWNDSDPVTFVVSRAPALAVASPMKPTVVTAVGK